MRKLFVGILAVFLFGCSHALTFSEEDEPFIEYEYGDYGPDLIYNLYSRKIIFYGNGKGEITTSINEEMGIDENAPHTVEFELEDEEIKVLQSELEKNKFFSLPEDLTDLSVMDGGYKYITVHTTDKSKKVGGGNPDNETLDALAAQIKEMVPRGTIRSFNEGIEEYQRKQGLRD